MILTILPLPTTKHFFEEEEEEEEEVVKSVKNISDLGKKLKDCRNKQLVKAEILITETISKNKLRLPRKMIDGKSGDAKNPILTPTMISDLRSVHQHRNEVVIKLFESEIFKIA